MSHYLASTWILLERLAARTTLPVTSKAAVRVAYLFMQWDERSRARKRLGHIPDAILRDIGLTRDQVSREAEKPFWRP
ncbi:MULTISPECIES: DUF1127 domain-containing protein [Actibacterium]|uniref:Uncharacterized protein YjiS (DUF1127 family) n=1 Tax=Actibacterium naphthalenivorans TaxID=1614693 RepID=A0A840CA89_9RHOB|nr:MULTISPECIES: DUF1127 domain-containing protein [Actibacterium]ALG90376.1 hypothetical protein TQ29_09415 [Actibacterium sp. EMB200-NS6]MBB4022305.1 uncharacterized protein YjiS (DUF1127 family) [Actibacterium naphthalenivorans]